MGGHSGRTVSVFTTAYKMMVLHTAAPVCCLDDCTHGVKANSSNAPVLLINRVRASPLTSVCLAVWQGVGGKTRDPLQHDSAVFLRPGSGMCRGPRHTHLPVRGSNPGLVQGKHRPQKLRAP